MTNPFLWMYRLVTGSDSSRNFVTVSRDSKTPWEVKNGELLFFGHDYTPLHPMSLQELELHLQRVKELVAATPPTVLEAVRIERHIAKGLWDEGAITFEHLQMATCHSGTISFQMVLLGEPTWVSIRSATYYENYEFIVRGHPKGIEVVRDVPDALAAVGKIEEVF